MAVVGLKIKKELRSLSSRQLMENTNQNYSTVTDRRKIKHRRKGYENQMKSNILIMKSQSTKKVKKWLEVNSNLLEDKKPIKDVDLVRLSQRRIQDIHSFLDNPQDTPASVEFLDNPEYIYLDTPVSVDFISSQESNNDVESNKEVSICNNTKELKGTKPNADISDIDELLESIASDSINLSKNSNKSKAPKEISHNLFVINNLNEAQNADSLHNEKCDFEFDNFLQEICTLKVNGDTATAINDNALFSLSKTKICQDVASNGNICHEKDKSIETKQFNNALFAEKESLQLTKNIDFCNVSFNKGDTMKDKEKSIELTPILNKSSGGTHSENDLVDKNETEFPFPQIHAKSVGIINVSIQENSNSQHNSELFNKSFRNDEQNITRISNKNDETISVNSYDGCTIKSVDYFQVAQTYNDKLMKEKKLVKNDIGYTEKRKDLSDKNTSVCSTSSKDHFFEICNKKCESLISESSNASNINITKKVLRYAANSVTSSSYFLEKPKIKKAIKRKCTEKDKKSIKKNKEQIMYTPSTTSSDYFLDLNKGNKIINIDKQLESSIMLNETFDSNMKDDTSIKKSKELDYLNKKDMLILDMDSFLESKALSQSDYANKLPDCIISPEYTFSENYIDLNEAFTNVEIFILKVNAEMDLQEDKESLIDYVNSQMSDVKKYRITSKNNLNIDFPICEKKLQISIDSMLYDKDMVYPSCDFIEYKDNTNLILRKIINIFSALCNKVLKNEKLELAWQKPANWKDVDYLDNMLVCKKPNSLTHTKLTNSRSKTRFKIMIYVLKKIYNLLMVDSYINQREIYYQIINYVSSSIQVFNAIDTVSALLKEGTYDLNILSTSKGLAFGNLKIFMKDGEVIRYDKKGGTLIPNLVKNIKDIEASAYFILVVEKDAVFQKLSHENISQKIGRPFILITGKGYPDFSTRLFLKILWKLLSIPIFILADCDPYGIEIMLCYKFGSLSLHMYEELAIPNARWLGVHPSELNLLNIACKKMSEKEVKKIQSISKRSYMRSETRIVKELQILLKKRQKAEIEGLIKSNNFLSNFYLPNKLYTKDFM